MTLDDVVASLRRMDLAREGACLSACCAISVGVLCGEDPVRAQRTLADAFAAAKGGATFGNARTLLARLFRVRSEVVSGRLERMLELNGARGQVLLGVNPRLLYAGAGAGRHAVLLTSTREATLPQWARGLLEDVSAPSQEVARFIDPSRRVGARQEAALSVLSSAFDAAGREALLVEPARS
jgi:hypothetical protein